MSITTHKTPANPPENQRKFQGDFVALKFFGFANPRTWEVLETKDSERPILGHGTWEGTETKAVVENVRNRKIRGDKLPQREGIFRADFRHSRAAIKA